MQLRWWLQHMTTALRAQIASHFRTPSICLPSITTQLKTDVDVRRGWELTTLHHDSWLRKIQSSQLLTRLISVAYTGDEKAKLFCGKTQNNSVQLFLSCTIGYNLAMNLNLKSFLGCSQSCKSKSQNTMNQTKSMLLLHDLQMALGSQ